ncbi:MAG: nucleotidyltransferase domain-containing protein, partial [Mediterranea sp.]|nr:nucleotidyltransferase domain-containing protein [Mediterranea sp.]
MRTNDDYILLLRAYMQNNAAKYGISRMGIFGSVARNEHTSTSDIDIFVEGQLHGF